MKRYYLLLSLAISFGSHAQSAKTSSLEKIQEVYGSYWAEVEKIDTDRQKVLVNLLENRVQILQEPYFEGEKYQKLSTIPLFNKYNNKLKRDMIFDENAFNVLKYDINFFSSNDQVYRIDNTNYIVYIKSVKNN